MKSKDINIPIELFRYLRTNSIALYNADIYGSGDFKDRLNKNIQDANKILINYEKEEIKL